MSCSEKHLVLTQYFSLMDYSLIEQQTPITFEYNGDVYKVLDQEEFQKEVDWMVSDICDEVEFYIDQIEIELRHFMTIKPNKKVIEEEVINFYEDYIGTGTGELYEGYYILLMQ